MARDFKPYEKKLLIAIWKEINNPKRIIIPKGVLMVEMDWPRDVFYPTFARLMVYTESIKSTTGNCTVYPEQFKTFLKEKHPDIYSVIKTEEGEIK